MAGPWAIRCSPGPTKALSTSRRLTTCRASSRRRRRNGRRGRPCRKAGISSNEPVDRLGQGHVLVRHAARRVGAEPDRDLVVDVRPFRVMVGGLRQQRHPRHEAEGLGKVLELELPLDGSAIGVRPPTRQPLKGRRPLAFTENRHRRSPSPQPTLSTPARAIGDNVKMADDLGRILEQATQIWHKKLREALASQGPPSALGAGAAVLEQLGAGGLPQTQLTARMGLSKQAVQQLLDALEADELLVRVQDTVDRRIKHVQLTAAGQAAAKARQQAQAALELRCKDALGKKEFKRLRKSLRAVIDRNV